MGRLIAIGLLNLEVNPHFIGYAEIGMPRCSCLLTIQTFRLMSFDELEFETENNIQFSKKLYLLYVGVRWGRTSSGVRLVYTSSKHHTRNVSSVRSRL